MVTLPVVGSAPSRLAGPASRDGCIRTESLCDQQTEGGDCVLPRKGNVQCEMRHCWSSGPRTKGRLGNVVKSRWVVVVQATGDRVGPRACKHVVVLPAVLTHTHEDK